MLVRALPRSAETGNTARPPHGLCVDNAGSLWLLLHVRDGGLGATSPISLRGCARVDGKAVSIASGRPALMSSLA
jgi:hypothetical protein